jgi:small-conductance mechanosensitive channel
MTEQKTCEKYTKLHKHYENILKVLNSGVDMMVENHQATIDSLHTELQAAKEAIAHWKEEEELWKEEEKRLLAIIVKRKRELTMYQIRVKEAEDLLYEVMEGLGNSSSWYDRIEQFFKDEWTIPNGI